MRTPTALAPWIGDLGMQVQPPRTAFLRRWLTGAFLHTLVRFWPFYAGRHYGVRWSS